MTRISSQKVRQAVLVTGDPLDPNTLPEKIQLFNEQGDPLMLGSEGARSEQEETTAVLDPGEQHLDTLTAAPSLRLYKISSNRPARVRVYSDETARNTDQDRGIGRKPPPNSGRLLEVVTTAGMLELVLSPAVDLVSAAEFVSDFYVSVTNLDSVAGAVVITYYYIRTE